jgi:predicted transcriptional regulator
MIIIMRTTLDLTDEAYNLAKAIAREKDLSLGRTVSEIILQYANPKGPSPSRVVVKDGLPYITVGRVVTNEEVRKILDESE